MLEYVCCSVGSRSCNGVLGGNLGSDLHAFAKTAADRLIAPAFGAYTGGMDAGSPAIISALTPAYAIDAVLPAKGKLVTFPLYRDAA